jgi:hypothetical protein
MANVLSGITIVEGATGPGDGLTPLSANPVVSGIGFGNTAAAPDTVLGPVLIAGATAPNTGAGIVAPLGSVCLVNTGGLFQKTGAGNTAWAPTGSDSRELADPGNAGAIPVTTGGVVMLVTAGAETRTVADPVAVGLLLTLFFLTDGGDCVVTFASPINTAANTISTINDVRDSITLVSVRDGAAAFAWALIANNGTVLS